MIRASINSLVSEELILSLFDSYNVKFEFWNNTHQIHCVCLTILKKSNSKANFYNNKSIPSTLFETLFLIIKYIREGSKRVKLSMLSQSQKYMIGHHWL